MKLIKDPAPFWVDLLGMAAVLFIWVLILVYTPMIEGMEEVARFIAHLFQWLFGMNVDGSGAQPLG